MKHSIIAQQMNINDMVQYVVKADYIHVTGKQIVLRFPNNFGASIVKHHFSYGEFAEIALIKFPGKSNEHFELKYFEPFGDQVKGCDTPKQVHEALIQIMQLEAE